ncbi:MAG: tryptophan-rich sensory protein [Parcubacteria group bacterium]|nr:tryptophan-rich sensory protein [Parcubacteria group bacterium]
MDYQTYYQSITKPFFAPPAWMFGLAWGIIYPLIAVTFAYFLFLLAKKKAPPALLFVFLANLAANFAFTPLQLGLENTALATLDIFIVLGTLAYFEYRIYRHSKLIFILLAPYLLWGAFATTLQVAIIFLN